MAIQKQGWVTLDVCINEYIDRAELSYNKYSRLWQIGFAGMQKMGLNFFYQIQSIKLPINSNFTVNLPDNYLNWCKVGVLNERGEIIPLDYNNKLTLFADLQTNRATQTEDNSIFNFYFGNADIYYNYWNGDTFENLFGLPSGGPFVGGFKIDQTNGLIVLTEHFFYNYVVLEYVASPKEGSEYRIPVQFEEAMLAFMAWQDNYFKPSTSHMQGNDKERLKHNFYNELRLAKAQFRPFSLEEAYDWALKNQRFCVKG